MLDRKTRRLASGKNFAVLTTLMPDGTPQSHVMWVDHDDEHILINTEVHRRKFKNLEEDPRATVTIIDADDGYSYVEIRGRVVDRIEGQDARDHIDELSRRYFGKDYPNRVHSERVVLRIRPDREIVH